MNQVGIYSITSPTNKVYIGQSWNLRKRFQHYKSLESKKQKKLHSSLLKYGPKQHIFNILLPLKETTTQGWLDYWECFFINYYKEENIELLNLRGGGSRGKHTPEAVEKIRLANIGRIASVESRQKMGDSRRKYYAEFGSPNLGKVRSAETKEKLRNANLGKKLPKNHPFLRTRRGIENNKARAIKQFDLNGNFIKEWSFITDAATTLNLQYSGISFACSGRYKQSGGFVWKYKEKENV